MMDDIDRLVADTFLFNFSDPYGSRLRDYEVERKIMLGSRIEYVLQTELLEHHQKSLPRVGQNDLHGAIHPGRALS